MKRAILAGAASAAVLLLLGVFLAPRVFEENPAPAAEWPPAPPPTTPEEPAEGPRGGFITGRITTLDGARFEGRLRWGGTEEAFWNDSFNGVKAENPWATRVPPERLPKERHPFKIFGFQLFERERPMNLRRPFVASFGDLVRIDARGRDVRVTQKSGTVVNLDRLEASDFDDGVRVWDAGRGVVDLDSLRIWAIEFRPQGRLEADPERLHGTVHTSQGAFTGFVQWNREKGFRTDELVGRSAGGELRLSFDSIRAITRRSGERALVTLADGRELELSGAGDRGIYVDDSRVGRVLAAWGAVERIDFGPGAPGDSGPAYDDFPPGQALRGSVTTRAGVHRSGRLVFDLDESETTDALDGSRGGVNYSLLFGRITSLVLPPVGEPAATSAAVTLADGTSLELDSTGDLGPGNAGLLVFVEGREQPEYVPWREVERLELAVGSSLP